MATLVIDIAFNTMPDSALTPDNLNALLDQALVDATVFDLAPVSLWLEDYSRLRSLFSRWRAADVQDLPAYFAADPKHVLECVDQLRVLKVNQMTVELYGGNSQQDFIGPITSILNEASLKGLAYEFIELWDGKTRFSMEAVNRDLDGKSIDVAVTGILLPGHHETWDRVLVAVQDVTEREEARRYARGLFNHSPIALWVQDYSGVKRLFEQTRSTGMTDFRQFLESNEEFVLRCLQSIRIIEVNQSALRLFEAPNVRSLGRKILAMTNEKKAVDFINQLVDLWDGKLEHQRELAYQLDGKELYLYAQVSVFPGHEQDWSIILTALIDITARKRAEAHLEYLGNHDELTKLHNRFFFNDYIKRLHLNGQFPVSVVMIDLNGLKRVNDETGHAAGDAMIRRAGEVLGKGIVAPACACRIGGDEFAILMPATDEQDAAAILEQLHALIHINNQFYATEAPLRISAGIASAIIGEQLEQAIRLADTRMYEAKNRYYANAGPDRRR